MRDHDIRSCPTRRLAMAASQLTHVAKGRLGSRAVVRTELWLAQVASVRWETWGLDRARSGPDAPANLSTPSLARKTCSNPAMPKLSACSRKPKANAREYSANSLRVATLWRRTHHHRSSDQDRANLSSGASSTALASICSDSLMASNCHRDRKTNRKPLRQGLSVLGSLEQAIQVRAILKQLARQPSHRDEPEQLALTRAPLKEVRKYIASLTALSLRNQPDGNS
jgi:hypothetical protein